MLHEFDWVSSHQLFFNQVMKHTKQFCFYVVGPFISFVRCRGLAVVPFASAYTRSDCLDAHNIPCVAYPHSVDRENTLSLGHAFIPI